MGDGPSTGCGATGALLLFGLMIAACAPVEPPACPGDQVPDEATGSCVPAACGAGPWGLIERASSTIHVAPWGDEDGDGSEAEPFDAIERGADAAAERGSRLVAVAAGLYSENFELGDQHDRLVIAGRCADLVTIDGSSEQVEVIWAHGGDLTLKDLTITGGEVGVWVERVESSGTADLDLEDVAFVRNLGPGLLVVGSQARVDASGCAVSDTLPGSDGSFGRGIEVYDGGRVRARELSIVDATDIGLFAAGPGTSVELEDSTVRGTRLSSDGTGWGIGVDAGASVLGRGLLLEGNHDAGVHVSNSGAIVELETTVIRDTRPDADGDYGRGVTVVSGGALTARGLVLEENHDLGLFIADAGSLADLEDCRIWRTQPLPSGIGGGGVGVQDGGRLVARGLVLERNHEYGLTAQDPGTTVDLEDTTIRETQPLPDGTVGLGVAVQTGAGLVGRSVLIEGNRIGGLAIDGAGTVVELIDVTVRDTLPAADGTFGGGVAVGAGASVSARGLLIEGSRHSGFHAVDPGTVVNLEGLTIRDTGPELDGSMGWGLIVREGAVATVRGALVEASTSMGLFAGGSGASVDLEEVTVRDTRSSPDGTSGIGVDVQDGAALVARGLVVEGSHLVGIAATDFGTRADLQDVTVTGTRADADGMSGFGVGVAEAVVTALGLVVEDNEGPGLYVVDSGDLQTWDASVSNNSFAGAVVIRGYLTMHGGVVSGSVPHPSEGGGLGVFGWNLDDPAFIELEGVTFSDLPGPALYARRGGRYVMRGCDVSGSGAPPWTPGGVFATGGIGPWDASGGPDGLGTGLLLAGNHFHDLPGDAILLDESSAHLDFDPETNIPNRFTDIGGAPLVNQRCVGVPEVQVLDGSAVETTCTSPLPVGPVLEYRLWLAETEAID